MIPTDIARMVWATSPTISPDGAHIAYVLRSIDAEANEYRSQIWLARTDDSSTPRPLTSGRYNEGGPCWTPDGSALAFTAKLPSDGGSATAGPGAGEKSSIQLLPFNSPGEAAVLATGDEGFHGLTFSPDGKSLAYVTRTQIDDYSAKETKDRAPRRIERLFYTLNGEGHIADRPEHVYVLPTNRSSGPVNLTPGSTPYSDPSWFPDSTRLAASVFDGQPDWSSDIRIISTDHNVEPVVISTRGEFDAPVVSPDGALIAVRGFDDPGINGQNSNLGVLTGEPGTAPRWITTDIDRTWFAAMAGQPPVWTSDGELLSVVEDRGDVHLYAASPDGASRLVAGGARNITGWAEANGVVAFTATSAEEPAELYVLVDGEERKLTDHTDTFVAHTKPRPVEHFVVQSGSGSDAVEVDAWLVTPPDMDPTKQYPMLVNIHGGPFTQYGTFHFDDAQLQAAAGFVVLMANPRGASGRHEGWGTSINGPKHRSPGTGWGSVDYDDVIAVTDAALERFDFVDPDRVGVLGGSYGGYLTSWIITHTDRFAAACSERAVNNMLSLEYGSDCAGGFDVIIGPSAFEDPAEYLRMSPISYVANIKTPLLIVHSEEDLRCPAEQANQLFVASQMLEIPDVEYYLFPGENHELSRSGSPTHRRQRAEIILEFFTRHLQPEVAATVGQ